MLPDKRVFRFFPLRSTIRGTCLYCLYSGKRSRSGCDESAVWSVLNPGLGCIDPVIHVISLSVLCILYLYTVLVLCILLIFQLAGTISISLTMPCGGDARPGSPDLFRCRRHYFIHYIPSSAFLAFQRVPTILLYGTL